MEGFIVRVHNCQILATIVAANAKQQDNLGSLTLGVVTFLAVRGVYVWLLNLALILYLFTGARALHKYLNEQFLDKSSGLVTLEQLQEFTADNRVLHITFSTLNPASDRTTTPVYFTRVIIYISFRLLEP
ncbi:hypothetical protein J6590_024412 [Homalodisca vitripennis]|nr:hypothetical protein J6590_024412 [Homalodisca vitripennis]